MLDEVELITFPDAEEAVSTFLRVELKDTMGWTGVKVSTQVQAGVHVQVLRTGGTTVGLLRDHAQVTLDCRAIDAKGKPDPITAARLANDCRALLLAAGRSGVLSGHTVYEVDAFAAPQNNPDPTTSAARYSATYTVPFRGITERS